MKKNLKLTITTIFLFLLHSQMLHADMDLPKLLYVNFLPLPSGDLTILGRVIWDDEDDYHKPMADRHFESFFKHRGRNIILKIGQEPDSITTKTDHLGDFELKIPHRKAKNFYNSREIEFSFDGFKGLIQKVQFNLPTNPQMLIISDLDDTVLTTEVTSKGKMLYNTFFVDWRERKPVEGTPTIYNRLIGNPETSKRLLVFLTASPIYIAPRIEAFLNANGFPPYSLLVRKIGLKENLWDKIFPKGTDKSDFLDVVSYKLTKLIKLLNMYPKLPVILIGDSGEKDPEIYYKIALVYKKRIKAVIIRDVTNQDEKNPRYEKLHQQTSLIIWKDPKHLVSRLEQLELFPTKAQ